MCMMQMLALQAHVAVSLWCSVYILSVYLQQYRVVTLFVCRNVTGQRPPLQAKWAILFLYKETTHANTLLPCIVTKQNQFTLYVSLLKHLYNNSIYNSVLWHQRNESRTGLSLRLTQVIQSVGKNVSKIVVSDDRWYQNCHEKALVTHLRNSRIWTLTREYYNSQLWV